MTDNTPRPSEHSEPMTKDEVCGFLRAAGAFGGVPYDELCKVTNAVAALYVKNAQLEAQLQERISELFAMELERDALRRALRDIVEDAAKLPGTMKNDIADAKPRLVAYLRQCIIGHAKEVLGTEASDAEGGG